MIQQGDKDILEERDSKMFRLTEEFLHDILGMEVVDMLASDKQYADLQSTPIAWAVYADVDDVWFDETPIGISRKDIALIGKTVHVRPRYNRQYDVRGINRGYSHMHGKIRVLVTEVVL